MTFTFAVNFSNILELYAYYSQITYAPKIRLYIISFFSVYFITVCFSYALAVSLCQQTKRKSGIGEEAARIAVNILNRNSGSPFPKKTGKEKEGEKKEKEVKKGVS